MADLSVLEVDLAVLGANSEHFRELADGKTTASLDRYKRQTVDRINNKLTRLLVFSLQPTTIALEREETERRVHRTQHLEEPRLTLCGRFELCAEPVNRWMICQ